MPEIELDEVTASYEVDYEAGCVDEVTAVTVEVLGETINVIDLLSASALDRIRDEIFESGKLDDSLDQQRYGIRGEHHNDYDM